MKFAKNLVKTVFALGLIGSVLVFSSIFYVNRELPTDFKVTQGESLTIHSELPLKAVYTDSALSQGGAIETPGATYNVDLKLFGMIPVGKAKVEVVNEMYVAVLGEPFGIKIYTEGVLVVGLTDVDAEEGNRNPAKEAGIQEGDFIKTINGEKVYSNADVSRLITESQGRPLEYLISRDGKEKKVTFAALKSKQSGTYKAGLWVRDSSAGIGTLTFYSPACDVICGLGHGICDVDTGELLSLNSGELVNAEIIASTKGKSGAPGELKGRFESGCLAKLISNDETGVYGYPATEVNCDDLMPVALKQEVVEGPAQILATVSGHEPKRYDCEIEVKHNSSAKTQNLVIHVTDPEILQNTGGIVQGMSGSPIIQNGKLIGAVTHVLVDDPTLGYGIFAESMLETAQELTKQELKEAS